MQNNSLMGSFYRFMAMILHTFGGQWMTFYLQPVAAVSTRANELNAPVTLTITCLGAPKPCGSRSLCWRLQQPHCSAGRGRWRSSTSRSCWSAAKGCTWTPAVCKITVFWALCRGIGPLFYNALYTLGVYVGHASPIRPHHEKAPKRLRDAYGLVESLSGISELPAFTRLL